MEYKEIRVIGRNAPVSSGVVFDVKKTLKRKARLVARGDKADPPSDSIYSGFASLLITFIAELNGVKLTGGDIGNAYLGAYTKEKVCVRTGPEFGPLEGHMMVIDKALYGLCTSGARFQTKFTDTLRNLDFTPSYADPDVWLRDTGDCYEYLEVYVDDILTALKEPGNFYEAITNSRTWKSPSTISAVIAIRFSTGIPDWEAVFGDKFNSV